MALSQTTLSAAITASQLQIPLASTLISGFPAVGLIVNQPVQIDGEFMLLKQVLQASAPGLIQVSRRGNEGSAAVAHDVNAIVVLAASASDFPANPVGATVLRSPDTDEVVALGQDQTINIPTSNSNYEIVKATAAAITINPVVAPASVGVILQFVSLVAAAHTITYTPGFNANTTLSDVLSFGGRIGDAVTVQVLANGTLAILAANNVSAG